MALNKITYDNKQTLVDLPSVAEVNKCTASNLNEIKSVVNNAIDQVDTNTGDIGTINTTITDMNTTELTEATLNSTYFSTIDYNSVVRVGKVVTVSVRALFKANTSGTVSLLTLPFNFKDGGEVVGYLGGRYDFANGAVWMYTGSSKYLYIGTNTTLNGKWLHFVYTYIMP